MKKKIYILIYLFSLEANYSYNYKYSSVTTFQSHLKLIERIILQQTSGTCIELFGEGIA